MDRVVAGWLVTVVLAFWAGWKAANRVDTASPDWPEVPDVA